MYGIDEDNNSQQLLYIGSSWLIRYIELGA